MGSLASRPKVPTYQPPAPIVRQPIAVSNTPARSDPETIEREREETASEARTSNLLSRSRGIFGTVRTGFRGLSETIPEANTGRKRLLGE